MGSPEGRLHAESKKFHGERSAGERGQNQPWLQGEMVIKI
jgi:hypothetical protein